MNRRIHVSGHYREVLRTNLWLVPALLVVAGLVLFVVTLLIDQAAFHGDFTLPSWVISGSADRLVQRSFEKIRQSARGNPAVLIRLLDALARIMERTTTEDQRRVRLDQASMIIQASDESVPDAPDRADVRRKYEALLAVRAHLADEPLPASG